MEHSMPFCMLSQAGRASASHSNVLPQHGRREGRYHAVVEKEVGFSQRRVTFFKCAIRSIFKYKHRVCSLSTHLPTFLARKSGSTATFAFLAGVLLMLFQKYAALTRVTSGLYKARCFCTRYQCVLSKPQPSAALPWPAAGCRPGLAESPRPQMIH